VQTQIDVSVNNVENRSKGSEWTAWWTSHRV